MQLQTKQIGIISALALLMAATRMHHYGSALHLPDASVAVFLLAGFFIASPLFFGALLLEAGALDYVAITQLGVSDWCVTPAYWFLIPTYAVLWGAGRYYARIHQYTASSLGVFSAVSLGALSAAFVISNGSFYLFSGRHPNLSFAEYVARLAEYYPQYLTGGLLYLACAAALYAVFAARAPLTGKVVNK
ncbi:MAG TPA: hypothetical protein VFK88_01970 [Gallionella sp.]|nr:hypothetical protein [Gallionella sp.]